MLHIIRFILYNHIKHAHKRARKLIPMQFARFSHDF